MPVVPVAVRARSSPQPALRACAFWLFAVHHAAATVQLPRWFSDGMVLQSSDEDGPPAFLAGRTVPPGETVSITGDAGEYTTTSEPASGPSSPEPLSPQY